MEITPGARATFGDYLVTREEVLEFAAKYDPQPFHLDDAAAAANPIFGRVSASGWHTCAMVMRMTVDHWAHAQNKVLGAAGVDQIRWLRPVYPGDRLRCESVVLEVAPGKPRPGMVMATVETTTFNQDDVPVMRHIARPMFRDPTAAPAAQG
jgi:acyl dehydratase